MQDAHAEKGQSREKKAHVQVPRDEEGKMMHNSRCTPTFPIEVAVEVEFKRSSSNSQLSKHDSRHSRTCQPNGHSNPRRLAQCTLAPLGQLGRRPPPQRQRRPPEQRDGYRIRLRMSVCSPDVEHLLRLRLGGCLRFFFRRGLHVWDGSYRGVWL